jgi:hypothetical protein
MTAHSTSRAHSMPTARQLLLAGAAAAPLFALVAIAQAAVRSGFDPMRHAVSQLTLGSGGWVQILNFVVTGALMIACAVGLRRVLQGGTGARWVPILVAVQGAGFVAAAFFPADPGNGFPPETAGSPPMFSATGMIHLACAGIAFLALAAACFVLARRFGATGERGWAIAGRVGGVLLLVGFGYANSGSYGGPLAMFVGVLAAWLWVGVSAARLARRDG